MGKNSRIVEANCLKAKKTKKEELDVRLIRILNAEGLVLESRIKDDYLHSLFIISEAEGCCMSFSAPQIVIGSDQPCDSEGLLFAINNNVDIEEIASVDEIDDIIVDYYIGVATSIVDIKHQEGLGFGDIISFSENISMSDEDYAELVECDISEVSAEIEASGEGKPVADSARTGCYIYLGDGKLVKPEDLTKKKLNAIKEVRKLLKSESISFTEIHQQLTKGE